MATICQSSSSSQHNQSSFQSSSQHNQSSSQSSSQHNQSSSQHLTSPCHHHYTKNLKRTSTSSGNKRSKRIRKDRDELFPNVTEDIQKCYLGMNTLLFLILLCYCRSVYVTSVVFNRATSCSSNSSSR